MTRKILLCTLILSISMTYMGCDKEDPIIINGEEVITTLSYTLTPVSGGNVVTLVFRDLDGEDGGNPPVITGGTLEANQTYTGNLTLLNESVSPVENITEEIEEEAEEHQFFFKSTISDLTISYADQDISQNPIGLSSSLTTGMAASGSVTVILRHEPNKSASNVSNGDITNAGGETDIEVIFPIDVQ